MKILYIFPHPDDESFGPAAAVSAQRRDGHEVYLLTLTRGGATRQRFRLGYSVEQMGTVRLQELEQVAAVLALSGLTVLDLPDSGLKEMDPREIEDPIVREIDRIRPDIVVTYAVHGVSGFHDHLVVHAVVKRAFLSMRDNGARYLRRLAFFTLDQESVDARTRRLHTLHASTPEEIDCVVRVEPEDGEAMRAALDCYETYQQVVQGSGVLDLIGRNVSFEIFQEEFDPPLNDLAARLQETP